LSGIDLNIDEQLFFLAEFEKFYKDLPWTDEKDKRYRYYYRNDAYGYSDGICLYCMIRYLAPNHIIEVGSGYSSCAILDTNELFFENKIKCTFIEPFPALLKSLVKTQILSTANILETTLQNIPLDTFKKLQRNDILFIDSTHVSKFKSDVNYIIHEILPILADGVYIHFHDIFYPFEYPNEWLLEGIAWNEAYILRAFLEYNTKFKIKLFNTFLQTFHKNDLVKKFPLLFMPNKSGSMKNAGGSIWLEKA
jgi:predicted O-methyltransferase YrrM